jgi:DNA-binding NarL/FixJ family response regulator
MRHSQGFVPSCGVAKLWRISLLLIQAIATDIRNRHATASSDQQGNVMLSLNHIKITPRDEQVLQLLVPGCSNKEIAAQLNISPRTVKQHLRTPVPARRNPGRQKTSHAGNR